MHAFQLHAALHDWEPLVSHGCVAPGAQVPPPEHPPQLSVPSLQVAVCVPQLPHDRVVAPVQVHLPLWQLEPLGHAWPHVPQLLASLVVSAHTPEHDV